MEPNNKNVAVAGASGNIGIPLVSLLHAHNYTITALTRTNSTATFPPYVKVQTVDYTSIPSLTAALRGHHFVISTVSSFSLDVQPALIEAASLAGVKRFFPAEYGADLLNPLTRKFPILAQKVAVEELLMQKAEEDAGKGMSYTFLFTGLFLDWGLDARQMGGIILNLRDRTGKIYDGGDRVVSMTRLETVARGIVGCLEQEDETKNRGVYIQDVAVSQNKLLAIARKVDPEEGKEWVLEEKDTAEMERVANEVFEKGGTDVMAMAGSVFRMYFGGEQYGMPFQRLDNELLRIEGMGEEELEGLVRDIMNKK